MLFKPSPCQKLRSLALSNRSLQTRTASNEKPKQRQESCRRKVSEKVYFTRPGLFETSFSGKEKTDFHADALFFNVTSKSDLLKSIAVSLPPFFSSKPNPPFFSSKPNLKYRPCIQIHHLLCPISTSGSPESKKKRCHLLAPK